jgi:glycosyltransferase involved in cell wall biosynthesis
MINIICRENGSGLTKDIKILQQIIKGKSRLINFDRHIIPPKADINLFVELFDIKFKDAAPKNYIIPNQEWYYDDWKKYIPAFDLILCKTKLAYDQFSKLGGKCVFTSFTSFDHYLPIKKKRKILHASNNSRTKGTDHIIQTYSKYPDLPPITILSGKIKGSAPNIQKIDQFVPDLKFKMMQNQHQIHLCPSVSEGFGHYIVEAMSAKCVVITTDGSPMNELVTEDRGFLIPVELSEPFRMGDNHYWNEVDLINSIFEAWRSTDLKEKGEAAREWYLQNDLFFKEKIQDIF